MFSCFGKTTNDNASVQLNNTPSQEPRSSVFIKYGGGPSHDKQCRSEEAVVPAPCISSITPEAPQQDENQSYVNHNALDASAVAEQPQKEAVSSPAQDDDPQLGNLFTWESSDIFTVFSWTAKAVSDDYNSGNKSHGRSEDLCEGNPPAAAAAIYQNQESIKYWGKFMQSLSQPGVEGAVQLLQLLSMLFRFEGESLASAVMEEMEQSGVGFKWTRVMQVPAVGSSLVRPLVAVADEVALKALLLGSCKTNIASAPADADGSALDPSLMDCQQGQGLLCRPNSLIGSAIRSIGRPCSSQMDTHAIMIRTPGPCSSQMDTQDSLEESRFYKQSSIMSARHSSDQQNGMSFSSSAFLVADPLASSLPTDDRSSLGSITGGFLLSLINFLSNIKSRG